LEFFIFQNEVRADIFLGMLGFLDCRFATKEFWLGYWLKSFLSSVRANYFLFVQNHLFFVEYPASH